MMMRQRTSVDEGFTTTACPEPKDDGRASVWLAGVGPIGAKNTDARRLISNNKLILLSSLPHKADTVKAFAREPTLDEIGITNAPSHSSKRAMMIHYDGVTCPC